MLTYQAVSWSSVSYLPRSDTFAHTRKGSHVENFIGFVIIALVVWGVFALDGKNKKDKAGAEVTRANVLKKSGAIGPFSAVSSDDIGNGGWLFREGRSDRMWYFPPNSLRTTELTKHNLQSAELVIDGTSVAHASRPRQIGSALVGGALAGPAGAVVGGLGAKPSPKEYTNRITLRITLNSGQSPLIDFPIATAPGKGVKKGTAYHNELDRKARTWHSYIVRLIEQTADTPQSPSSGYSSEAPNPEKFATEETNDSIVSQLSQLSNLRDSGALTEEEFQSMKRRVIENEAN